MLKNKNKTHLVGLTFIKCHQIHTEPQKNIWKRHIKILMIVYLGYEYFIRFFLFQNYFSFLRQAPFHLRLASNLLYSQDPSVSTFHRLGLL